MFTFRWHDWYILKVTHYPSTKVTVLGVRMRLVYPALLRCWVEIWGRVLRQVRQILACPALPCLAFGRGGYPHGNKAMGVPLVTRACRRLKGVSSKQSQFLSVVWAKKNSLLLLLAAGETESPHYIAQTTKTYTCQRNSCHKPPRDNSRFISLYNLFSPTSPIRWTHLQHWKPRSCILPSKATRDREMQQITGPTSAFR